MAINFIGLDTAVSGMHSNQKSLEVTGHNISNIGTPGYTDNRLSFKLPKPGMLLIHGLKWGPQYRKSARSGIYFWTIYIAVK